MADRGSRRSCAIAHRNISRKAEYVNVHTGSGPNLLGSHVGDPRPPLLPLDEAGLDEMRSLLID
jgi:hypothetical protein